MKVKDSTPGEDMAQGKLVVSYRYKNTGDTPYTYGVSNEISGVSIATGAESSQYTFTFSDSNKHIPLDAEKEYMLAYRGGLGDEADAVAGKSLKPSEPLVIDNWEGGQNWTAEDSRVTLSPAEPGMSFMGTGALKADIACGEAAFFDNIDQSSSTSASVFDTCSGSMVGHLFAASVECEIQRVDFDLQAVGGCPAEGYYMTQALIYGEGGTPGVLIGSSNVQYLPCDGRRRRLSYTLPPAVKVNGGYKVLLILLNSGYPTYGNYVMVWAGKTNYPNYLYRRPWGDSPCGSLTWQYTGNVNSRYGISVYGKSDGVPVAYKEIAANCTGKDSIKLAVKTAITGNMINFVYGTDKDHAVEVPLNSTTTDWEVAEIPISADVDKSKLGYFAFKLGKDGIDADGNSIANTIYIDQLVAE